MTTGIAQTFWTVQQAAVHTIEPIKRLFYDWDETLNISRLCLKISDISGSIFGVTMPDGARNSLSAFCEFSGARNILKRSYELISGDAAWEKDDKLGRINLPSPLRCASKLASIVSDICSLTKWLTTCTFIDRRFFDITGHIDVFGNSVKLFQGVQDAAGFLTGAFMVPTNISAIVESVSYLGVEGLLRRTYLFDLAQDIAKMAGLVLLYIPGISPIYAAVSMTVGCVISLARFVKKNYFTDAERDRPILQNVDEMEQDSLIPRSRVIPLLQEGGLSLDGGHDDIDVFGAAPVPLVLVPGTEGGSL